MTEQRAQYRAHNLLNTHRERATMDAEGTTDVLREDLERLERDITGSLYSIWRLLGKRKKIVRMDK